MLFGKNFLSTQGHDVLQINCKCQKQMVQEFVHFFRQTLMKKLFTSEDKKDTSNIRVLLQAVKSITFCTELMVWYLVDADCIAHNFYHFLFGCQPSVVRLCHFWQICEIWSKLLLLWRSTSRLNRSSSYPTKNRPVVVWRPIKPKPVFQVDPNPTDHVVGTGNISAAADAHLA